MKFAAVGFSNQAEFYTCDGIEYFTLYNSNHDAQRQITIELEEWRVEKLEQGFDVCKGSRAHRFRFGLKNGEATLTVRSYLWRWLPYSRLGGELSVEGRTLIESNFGKYT